MLRSNRQKCAHVLSLGITRNPVMPKPVDSVLIDCLWLGEGSSLPVTGLSQARRWYGLSASKRDADRLTVNLITIALAIAGIELPDELEANVEMMRAVHVDVACQWLNGSAGIDPNSLVGAYARGNRSLEAACVLVPRNIHGLMLDGSFRAAVLPQLSRRGEGTVLIVCKSNTWQCSRRWIMPTAALRAYEADVAMAIWLEADGLVCGECRVMNCIHEHAHKRVLQLRYLIAAGERESVLH